MIETNILINNNITFDVVAICALKNYLRGRLAHDFLKDNNF